EGVATRFADASKERKVNRRGAGREKNWLWRSALGRRCNAWRSPLWIKPFVSIAMQFLMDHPWWGTQAIHGRASQSGNFCMEGPGGAGVPPALVRNVAWSAA